MYVLLHSPPKNVPNSQYLQRSLSRDHISGDHNTTTLQLLYYDLRTWTLHGSTEPNLRWPKKSVGQILVRSTAIPHKNGLGSSPLARAYILKSNILPPTSSIGGESRSMYIDQIINQTQQNWWVCSSFVYGHLQMTIWLVQPQGSGFQGH